MSDEATVTRECSRCGTVIESCAFCDEPDCPAVTCYRCVNIGLLDRRPPNRTASSLTQT
jgi:hypothetical protein